MTAGEEPWLADLALRGADGELYPAGELLLAEGALAGLLDPETHFGMAAPELVETVRLAGAGRGRGARRLRRGERHRRHDRPG